MITGLGRIGVRRTYFKCKGCASGEYAADRFVGIIGRLTAIARELVCLAGIGCGFAKAAAQRLRKFCGWTVSTQTMRRTCEAEGKRVEQWREKSGPFAVANPQSAVIEQPPTPSDIVDAGRSLEGPAAAVTQLFCQATGDIEFLTDGVTVNTTGGWRELRLALWLKRPRSPKAESWEWQTRRLERTNARAVLIDLADAESFGQRWRPWAAGLGITDCGQITALADGAEWIWRQLEIQYPGCAGVLDIYHGCEHFADASKGMFGSRAGAVQAWTDVGKRWLVTEGWAGVCRWVGQTRDVLEQSELAIGETEKLLNYLGKHSAHLNYAQRLQDGQSIGSGPVEGAGKQLVQRRLKQTGARWLPENAIRMATLCSCEFVDDWDLYWRESYLALAV